jgi:hypothetical protein
VIMPFRAEFDEVFNAVRTAAETAGGAVGLAPYWLKDVLAAGKITDDIVDGLSESSLCIADLTGNNPNVMWEAGYAMALGRPTVLIGQNVSQLPFDLRVHRILAYRREDLERLTRDLRTALQQTMARYEIRQGSAAEAGIGAASSVIAVTGSMRANPAKVARRLEVLLTPHLKRHVQWYCGSNGVVDQCAASFLATRREKVIAVGYTALDLADDIRTLVHKGAVEFLDASVESVQRQPGLSPRDTIFLAKADLLAVFWDGASKGTEALIRCCQAAGKNTLLGFI